MEFVSSITGITAEKIVDKLINATGRQFGYLYKDNDNIKSLRKQAKKLADARHMMQRKIDAAKRKAETIDADVQTWIEEVDSIATQVDKFLEDEVKANKKCLGGWCINFLSCYKFSREAEKKTLAISKLMEERKSIDDVSSPAPPPGIISSYLGIFRNFESRKSIMKQIMRVLNDENVSTIGLCGMGGVGKTTLVKEIGKQAKEDKLIDDVAMAVVSRNPSIETIQGDIADMLGLPLSGSSLSARARSLWARIKMEKRILIILDDVWETIELDAIGIPCGENHKGCKILLTSRSQEVCNQMDAKLFEIGTLSKRESWDLFREVAGQVVDDSEINPIARKVADKCGGLPIAILTVGRALKNKDKYVWKDAAQQLKKSSTTYIEGIQKNVISSLELSYSYLERQQEKSLFLFCCLFPEDFNISVEVLAAYGIGLNWFENVDTVEEARNRAHAVVSTLTSSFLLMSDKQGFVKMHDLVRDVAIEIAAKHGKIFMVNAGIKLLGWPSRNTYEDLTGISLMSTDIHEFPDHVLECPKLQALLLQQNSALVIPNIFFQEMKDLKVLDLSDTQLFSLPQSLSLLANLRILCLSQCKLGNDLSAIGELTLLEILNLSRSDIKVIPANFSQLIRLRLLDMNYCRGLKLIPRGVISCLGKLEELFMFECSMISWDFGNNAKLVELEDLSRLTKLMINIPRRSTYPNFISFQKLTTFIVSIGATWEELYTMSFGIGTQTRVMIIKSDMSVSPLPPWVKDLLNRSERIMLDMIDGAKSIVGDLVSEMFTDLKYLTVRCCYRVNYLIDTSKLAPHTIFPNLDKLVVYYCPNFVEICHGLLPAEAFSKLQHLLVNICSGIVHIVSSHLLQRLQNLKAISILNCASVIHVFDLQGLEVGNEETQFLTSLEDITMAHLPKMTHIWKGDIRFLSLHSLKSLGLWNCDVLKEIFPQALSQSLNCLEKIEVSGCHDLEEIFGRKEEEIVLQKKCHTEGLGNLSYVNVESCGKLVNLFTASMAKSLVQLKKLYVSWCSGMQEIVMIDEEESAEKIVFPSLNSMELKGLDSLTCFFPGRCPIEFPALVTVKIVECPKMKTFGHGDIVTLKLNKVNLQGKRQWKDNLNGTMQKFFHEQEKIQKEEETQA